MDNLSDSQFGISLPSKKYIDNIHNILKITDIVSKVNVYGSPAKIKCSICSFQCEN